MTKQNKEHYLTFFIPYYNNEKNKIQKFYTNEDYKRLNYKKYFYYEPFFIGYHLDQNKEVATNLAKLLLANSKLKYCNDINIKYENDLIIKLNNNDIQLALISTPAIAYYESNVQKNNYINNTKLVLKTSKRYVFFMTTNASNIDNITKLPLNIRIGTNKYQIEKDKDFNYIAVEILEYLKYNENKDFTFKYYDDFDTAGENLVNNNIDLLIWIDKFPNKTITNFLNNNAYYGIKILPFDVPQEKVFIDTFYQYNISYIDLNNISNTYLPVKFNNQKWSKYKPDLKILEFDDYLISNRYVNNELIYNLTDSYFKYTKDYIDLFSNYTFFYKGLELDNKQIPLSYHEGARKYYFDKGYMTNNPNPNCKYLVGVKECTDKTLADNNLTYY